MFHDSPINARGVAGGGEPTVVCMFMTNEVPDVCSTAQYDLLESRYGTKYDRTSSGHL